MTLRSNRFAVTLAAALALGGAISAASPPAAVASSSPRLPAPILRLRPGSASDRDLLGARARLRLDPERRHPATGAGALAIAAIRVEFVPESPDDPETTGDGAFDLATPGGPGLDRPPHDRAYFERQLLALENYWLAVSGGTLHLAPTLFPLAGDAGFSLPHPMRYYHPDTTAAGIDRRLAEFFADAVAAADPDLDFGAFDVVLVFHAGAGQDLALPGDPTPRDLPSAFLSFRELKAALAPGDPDFDGLPVDGGAHRVRDGLWLPETEVQEGIEFSLLGVMAALFGNQLGLPSLFNTESGAPGIGRFGLMDQGAGNEAGRLPAAPSAWSRFFLGFATPLVVRQGAGIAVRATLAAPDAIPEPAPDLVLLPIDSREYFLIENRQQELDGSPGFTLIDSLGTVIGVAANEYDAAIPGSGILIWHIDEEVIRDGLESNRINVDPERRGVDLEEADGIQDIGIRPRGGFGLAADCYRAGGTTRFGPDTSPSTRSNRGHATHIDVSGISASDLVMRFDVGVDIAQPGWPDSSLAAEGLRGVSLAAGDLDGDGAADLVLLTPGGTLVARRGDGAQVFPPVAFGDSARGTPLLADLEPEPVGEMLFEIAVPTASGVHVVSASGDTAVYRDWTRAFAPAVDGGPVAVPGENAIAALAAGGALHVWQRSTDLPGFPLPLDGPPRSNLAFDGADLIVAARGEILRVRPALEPGGPAVSRLPWAGSGPLWILAGALPRPPGAALPLAAVAWDGEVSLLDGTSGAVRPGWPRRTGDLHLGPPALADLDRDGALDLLVPGAGRVWAFGPNGALLPGWPAELAAAGGAAAGNVPAAGGTTLTGGPVVADLDGDGRLDLAIGSPAGGLWAFDSGARRLPGWPLPAGDSNGGTAVLADLDGDGDLEIAAASTDGWLQVYDLGAPAGGTPPTWPGAGGPGRTFAAPIDPPPGAGEPALLPPASLTAYPNPTRGTVRFRYEAPDGAAVAIDILDASGRTVRALAARHPFGGLGEITWDGRDASGDPVPSGVYVCRLEARAGGRTVSRLHSVAVRR